MAAMTAAERLEKKRQALLQKKEALKKEAKAIQNLAYQARKKKPATAGYSFWASFLKRCSAPMGGCSIFQTLKPKTFLPVTVTRNGTPRHQYLSKKGRD